MTKEWWQKCQLRPHKLQQLTLSCGKPHRIMMRHLPKCPTSKLQPNWTIQVLMADLWLNVDDIPCLWFLLAWSELPLPESRSIFFDCRILSKLHCELVEPICRCQLEVHLAGTSITRTRLTSNKWNYTIQLFERVIRSAMAELGWNSKFFRNSTRISFLGAIRNCCRYQIVSVVALHYERVEEGSILRHLHLLLEP